MLPIDEILELLKNGEWHGIREIVDKTRLQVLKVELITSFLAEYDFLEFDRKEKKVRACPQLRVFLKNIQDVEG